MVRFRSFTTVVLLLCFFLHEQPFLVQPAEGAFDVQRLAFRVYDDELIELQQQ